jgi:hypothetical protein
MKLTSTFVSNRKFRVTVEGKLSTQWDIEAGVPQVSVLSLTLYSVYINDTPQIIGVFLALFANDVCERERVNRSQRGSCSQKAATWAHLNGIMVWVLDKTQAMYFSYWHSPFKAFLKSKGQQIPFVNHVKYLSVIFCKKNYMEITYRNDHCQGPMYIFCIYPILKSECLSVITKLTLYKVLIGSVLTYACPAWEFSAESHLLKLQCLQNSSPHHW